MPAVAFLAATSYNNSSRMLEWKLERKSKRGEDEVGSQSGLIWPLSLGPDHDC